MDPKLVVGKPKRQVPEPQEFTWVVVGPVGFEPTTSGPKACRSWGRQRPRFTARSCALVSCWRKSCSQTKLSREASNRLF